MKTVQYGKWKIEVDVEKTKAYYRDYRITEDQAHRNFAEYCKALSAEEKSFFASLGITPECCEIEHIGVSKKKEFPCGGSYLFCGRYIEYPPEELITVEELAEKGFEDDREDPRIKIGIFEFDFQCDAYEISDIPEDIPAGFLCVKFWCEDMKWLLDEAPEDVMYEPPRFWEIGKRIKEKLNEKKQQKALFEQSLQSFKDMLDALGIEYSEFDSKEYKAYKAQWLDALCPADADKKAIRKICLENRKYNTFLWHLFSYEYVKAEEETAEAMFNACEKTACVLISNVDDFGFRLENARALTAEALNEFIDVTVTAADFAWTYSKTHEEGIGPYFYKR